MILAYRILYTKEIKEARENPRAINKLKVRGLSRVVKGKDTKNMTQEKFNELMRSHQGEHE